MLAYVLLKFELELIYFLPPLTTKNLEHHLVQVLYAEQALNLVWATCEQSCFEYSPNAINIEFCMFSQPK